MTVAQVKKYFMDKHYDIDSITEELVSGGYRQKKGGYIKMRRKKE